MPFYAMVVTLHCTCTVRHGRARRGAARPCHAMVVTLHLHGAAEHGTHGANEGVADWCEANERACAMPMMRKLFVQYSEGD